MIFLFESFLGLGSILLDIAQIFDDDETIRCAVDDCVCYLVAHIRGLVHLLDG